MKTKNKGFSPILAIIIVAVVVVIVVVFLSTQKGGLPIGIQQTTQNIPAIQDASGLDTVSSELDNIDMSQFDKELNQPDLDASTF